MSRRQYTADRCAACTRDLPEHPYHLLVLRRGAVSIRCPICDRCLSRWDRGGRGAQAVRGAILARVVEVVGDA